MRSDRRVLLVHAFGPEGYPPVIHAAGSLADAGFAVDVAGATMPAFEGLPWPEIPGVRRHSSGPWSGDRAGSFARLAAASLRLAVRHRPAWVWCSDPWSLPAAWPASVTAGARLVYQEHDSPPPDASGERIGRRALRPLRRLALRRADHVVFPNAARLAFARSEVGPGRGRDHVIWNLPTLAEVPRRVARAGRSGLRLHFHGSISPFALPVALIDALAIVRDTTLRIVGYNVGHPEHGIALAARARELGIVDRIEFRGACPRAEALALAAEADVGIAFFRPHPNNINHSHALGASNKVFDYLAAGLALLLSDAEEWRGTLVPTYGQGCDPESPVSIASALRKYIDSDPDPETIGASGRARIRSEWHHERAFAPMIDAMVRAS